MAKIHLITGACRSGKSRRAQELAESLPGPRIFVATCPMLDEEMKQRIAIHQADRAGRGWQTIEEQVDLAGVIQRCAGGTILVDCLTLWISNLMYRAEQRGEEITEQDIRTRVQGVLEACRTAAGNVVFVTNEVGWSIVPENAMARRYRDLVGRANQAIASAADHVTLMCVGIGIELKGRYANAVV